jgi:hypothetical protein
VGIGGDVQVPSTPLIECWGIALDPAKHRRMVDPPATFPQECFAVARAQRIARIPPHKHRMRSAAKWRQLNRVGSRMAGLRGAGVETIGRLVADHQPLLQQNPLLSEAQVGGRDLVKRPSDGFALSDAVVMLREDPHILDPDEDFITLPQP